MALFEETKERTTKALNELEEVVCFSLYSEQYMSHLSNPITTLDICNGLGLTTTAAVAIIQIILDKLESEGRIIRNLDNSEDGWERWELPTEHLTKIDTLLEQQGYTWYCGEWITKEELNQIHQSNWEQEQMYGDMYSEEARQEALEAEYYNYSEFCQCCDDYHPPSQYCEPRR